MKKSNLALSKLFIIIILAVALIVGSVAGYALMQSPANNSPSPSPSLTASPTTTTLTSATPTSTNSPSAATSSSSTPTPSGSSSLTPTPSGTSQPTSPVPTPTITQPTSTSTPVPTPTPVASGVKATFDFDTATPTLTLRQSTPFNQTINGITASFSSQSIASPGAFSIQTDTTTFFTLTQFSGKYLDQSVGDRITLQMVFSQALTNITLTFATVDYHDPGAGGTATPIKLTAYMNYVTSAAIGTKTAFGAFTSDTYPQGTISFTSTLPFNIVTLELPYINQGAAVFLIDNMIVTTA